MLFTTFLIRTAAICEIIAAVTYITIEKSTMLGLGWLFIALGTLFFSAL